jgi:uncharacterized Zn finger protein (UPF0148 family)
MTSAPRCPYCGADLKVRPQRKKKCPACKRPIYVKSTPEDREKRLMTEVQAEDAERRWSAYHERQKSISVLQTVGLAESDLERERAQGRATDSEAVVAILIRVAATAKKLHERKMAYYQLASYAEKEGRPFHEFLTEAVRCELLIYKQTPVVTTVEILTAGPANACAECDAQRGKVFSIDEALRTMPLPCPRCTRTLLGARPGFCRCTWLPVVEKIAV